MILVTGTGKLANELAKLSTKEVPIIMLPKEEMDVRNIHEVEHTIKKYMMLPESIECLIHTAAITKPMRVVDDNPTLALDTNIIGTANVAKICNRYGIKMIYISTDFVYPFNGYGNLVKETDPVSPPNLYGLTKYAGECAVQVYFKNNLILRCALCDIPFRHPVAYVNVYRNSMTHKNVAAIIMRVRHAAGTIINIGGEVQSVYDFVKLYDPDIKGEVYVDKGGRNASIRMDVNHMMNIMNGIWHE